MQKLILNYFLEKLKTKDSEMVEQSQLDRAALQESPPVDGIDNGHLEGSLFCSSCNHYVNIFKCCNALNALRTASLLHEQTSSNGLVMIGDTLLGADSYENTKILVKSNIQDELFGALSNGSKCQGLCNISSLLDAVRRRKNCARPGNEYSIPPLKQDVNNTGNGLEASRSLESFNVTLNESNAKKSLAKFAETSGQQDFSQTDYKFLPHWDLKCLETVFLHLFFSGFYLGRMSAEQAKDLLKDRPVGTFLIRDSADPKYLLSLSIQTPRGTTSIRIVYNCGLIRLDCEPDQVRETPTFDCVLKLIKHYMSIPTKNVLIESSGRRDTLVLLVKALELNVPSLTHICRKRINRHLAGQSVDRLCLSPSLKTFLKDYPYDI